VVVTHDNLVVDFEGRDLSCPQKYGRTIHTLLEEIESTKVLHTNFEKIGLFWRNRYYPYVNHSNSGTDPFLHQLSVFLIEVNATKSPLFKSSYVVKPQPREIESLRYAAEDSIRRTEPAPSRIA
jgi:hypothetical protein